MITRLYYVIKRTNSSGILQADLIKQGNKYFVELSIVKISTSFPVPALRLFEIETVYLKKWGRRFGELIRERCYADDEIEIKLDTPSEPEQPKKWFHKYRKGLK